MSSQVLSMKAFSYVRLQAGIHWFNMLRGATQILRFTEEIGNYWFSNIAVDKWDGLSNQVVSVKTIESFKRRQIYGWGRVSISNNQWEKQNQ